MTLLSTPWDGGWGWGLLAELLAPALSLSSSGLFHPPHLPELPPPQPLPLLSQASSLPSTFPLESSLFTFASLVAQPWCSEKLGITDG